MIFFHGPHQTFFICRLNLHASDVLIISSTGDSRFRSSIARLGSIFLCKLIFAGYYAVPPHVHRGSKYTAPPPPTSVMVVKLWLEVFFSRTNNTSCKNCPSCPPSIPRGSAPGILLPRISILGPCTQVGLALWSFGLPLIGPDFLPPQKLPFCLQTVEF